MKPITAISAVLIVGNEEAVLDGCLASLRDFAEVVVYLNNCTDASEAVARRHPHVKVVHGEFHGFSATRNAAARHADNDWIFAIDADERATLRLINCLRDWDTSNIKAVGAFFLRNHFMGKPIWFGFSKPRWKERLYHRRFVNWDNLVHEEIKDGSRITVRLAGELVHAQKSFPERMVKQRRYAMLSQQEGRQPKPQWLAKLGWAVHFLRSFLFQGGFLHGKAGFYDALVAAYWHYSKYDDTLD